MKTKRLLIVSLPVLIVITLIIGAIVEMIFYNEAEATERKCSPGVYCLEIEKVIIDQDVNNLIFSVYSVCRKWRDRAENLHLIVEAIHPDGTSEFISRRLKALSSGESVLKTIVLKKAKPGIYKVTFILRDTLTSAGMHVVEKEVKKI